MTPEELARRVAEVSARENYLHKRLLGEKESTDRLVIEIERLREGLREIVTSLEGKGVAYSTTTYPVLEIARRRLGEEGK